MMNDECRIFIIHHSEFSETAPLKALIRPAMSSPNLFQAQ